MRSCLRDTEKTAVDNCVKVQAALIQLSAKKAFIFTKKVKRKEKKKDPPGSAVGFPAQL